MKASKTTMDAEEPVTPKAQVRRSGEGVRKRKQQQQQQQQQLEREREWRERLGMYAEDSERWLGVLDM